MTSRDFAYWLQGYFEVSGATAIDAAATDLIKRHLNMVFVHEIDPSMGDAKHQAVLNAVHQGKPTEEKPAEVHHHHHDSNPTIRC